MSQTDVLQIVLAAFGALIAIYVARRTSDGKRPDRDTQRREDRML